VSAALYLKKGRDKSVKQHHPWIFSGAVERVQGSPGLGETVEIFSTDGEWLARAAYSQNSQIIARIWSWDKSESIGREFFKNRLYRAVEQRAALIPQGETDDVRLVHGESDGLPGLVVDRYADVLVIQCLSAGIELWLKEVVEVLVELTGCEQVYERSDVEVRHLEGLPERVGALHGAAPTEPLIISENGLLFKVDLLHGQKTGFYIDQRHNRQRVGALAQGRRVLNCFCYSGGFSVYALAGGASQVVSIDSSHEALVLARENYGMNHLSNEQVDWIEGDVFHELRLLRDRAQSFDAIILDPPKFAPTAAQAESAARGYKDINLLAFKLLRPGGLLFTFSCSGGISADLFQKIVAGAALDAGVDARIVEHLAQGPDHPVALNFPEGTYLKGLICVVN